MESWMPEGSGILQGRSSERDLRNFLSIHAGVHQFNNIPVSMFLSGPGVSTFPSTLMNYIEYNYDPTVSAVSVLLMAATVVIMVIVDRTLGIAALAK